LFVFNCCFDLSILQNMSTESSSSSAAAPTTEVTKAMSSYQFFQKLRMTDIKEEMVRNEKDTGLGAVMTQLSARWKSLTDTERDVYDQMALKDRERFNQETMKRDAEFLEMQEEKRRQNAATNFDNRARNSTMAMTDAAITKSEAPKRKRVVTEEEKRARERTKSAKADEERRVNVQHQVITDSKSEQAEARLKYLLSQSDIFSHFGLKGQKQEEDHAVSKKEERDRDRKKDRKGVVYDELDDDERALMEEAGDDSDDEGSALSKGSGAGKGKQHVLLRQPSIITGGEMRCGPTLHPHVMSCPLLCCPVLCCAVMSYLCLLSVLCPVMWFI
jgi:hypothetical protein